MAMGRNRRGVENKEAILMAEVHRSVRNIQQLNVELQPNNYLSARWSVVFSSNIVNKIGSKNKLRKYADSFIIRYFCLSVCPRKHWERQEKDMFS